MRKSHRRGSIEIMMMYVRTWDVVCVVGRVRRVDERERLRELKGAIVVVRDPGRNHIACNGQGHCIILEPTSCTVGKSWLIHASSNQGWVEPSQK